MSFADHQDYLPETPDYDDGGSRPRRRAGGEAVKIRVPDVPHDTLCYQQKFDPPGAMGRCDRPRGHLGPHSYALADCLRDLVVFEQSMRDRANALPHDDKWDEAEIEVRAWADKLAQVLAPYQAMIKP